MSEPEERTPVKHIAIDEFRQIGFLQEANRLFFHLHGLALEATVVDPKGWDADDGPRVELVAKAMAKVMDRVDEKDGFYTATDLALAALNALYPPGSQHLSGVWDYRKDPEGVIFGDGYAGKAENADRVHEQRLQHQEHRARLFGREGVDADRDVEPLGWTVSDEQIKEWRRKGDSD